MPCQETPSNKTPCRKPFHHVHIEIDAGDRQTMNKVRVLFVDDDSSIRLLAAAMFNSKIFEIAIAANAAEAEKMLRASSFDVIVCDVMMPGESGIEFCDRLRKSGVSTPFLFLSAVSNPDVINKGLEIGAKSYLLKPFEVKDLQRRILEVAPASVVAAALRAAHPPTPKSSRWFKR